MTTKNLTKVLLAAPLFLTLIACDSSDGGVSGTGAPTIIEETDGVDAAPSDTGDNEQNTDSTSLETGGDSGLLATATPQFQWQAIDEADAYQILMTEREGNQLTYIADTDACAGTDCSATPTAAYHDNDITWQVDALSGGEVIQSTDTGSYSTPLSSELTPEFTNEACEVWPAISYDDIIVLNNNWGKNEMFNTQDWTQSISAEERSDGSVKPSWSYNWLTETDGTRWAVKAYPQIIYGNKLGTHVSADKSVTGLPEIARDLQQYQVEIGFTETFNGQVERNVALESFFHDSCTITGPCHEVDNRAYEMMVWVENPDSNLPGDLAEAGVMIDNRLWDVYIKVRFDNPTYIAFTAQDEFSEGTLNWNAFVDFTIEWTAANADALGVTPLDPELCMGAIEMGTELWWGEGTFTLDKFIVTRN